MIAQEILKEDIVCSAECPLTEDCPRLIMEDATDEAVEKALDAMIRLIKLHQTNP